MKIHIALFVVVIVILIWIAARGNGSTYEEYLGGFWVGDSDFCESANVESMMLFLGENEGGVRHGYIIVQDDIANDPFTLSYWRGWTSPWRSRYVIRPTITFDSASGPFPEDSRFDLDAEKGILRILSGDVLYGKFYKQLEISDALTPSDMCPPDENSN